MKNVLGEYMRTRMERKQSGERLIKNAPVITISRQYGCPAKIVAQNLAIRLNKMRSRLNRPQNWRWISKEILDESARELKMDKHTVQEAVNADYKGVLDVLIWSLSNKFYPGDDKIKKTLGEVIRGFSRQGHVIIVGRGGVALTRENPNTLHVRLVAPLEWRIHNVSERQQLTYDEARQKIMQIDKKRSNLLKYFDVDPSDQALFDIMLNYKTMAETEIMEVVIQIMEQRSDI